MVGPDERDPARRSGFLPGLVFAWRRRRRRDWNRTALALIAVVVGTVGLSALINVEGRTARERMARPASASVMILRGDDQASRDLIAWAREESPDADRWDPREGTALSGILLEGEDEMRKASRYLPRLQPVPMRKAPDDVDVVVGLVRPQLPPVRVPENPDRQPEENGLEPRPKFTVSENLEDRWLVPVSGEEDQDWNSFVGREAVFSLAVAPSGKVEFCLPLRGIEPEVDMALQRRLREHQLAGVEDEGLRWGRVTVRVMVPEEDKETP